MNTHTEFAIAALAMVPLFVVSWAVTRHQQVAVTPPSGFTTSPQERAAAGSLAPKSGGGDSVRRRTAHRPVAGTHDLDNAIASQSR